MLTLWCYARYVEAPSRRRYLAVAGVFALALMSKPIVVTTPFVLLLLDYWPLGRFMTGAGAGWRLLREKLPLVALSAATCVIVLLTHATQQVGTRFVLRPLPTRLVDAIAGYGAYVLGAFWPANLSPYYPIETSGPTATSIAVGVAMLLVTAAACIFWRRTPPYLLVGLLWFVGMLVPVIGLLQIADAAHADRYTYLSEIGLAIAVAWGVANLGLWQRAGQEGTAGSRLLVTAAFVPVVVLAVLGYRQTAFWRNDETLWTRAIDCDPDNLIARYLLGRYFVREGKTEQGIAELRRAIASYSLKEYMLSDAHALLARTLSEEGQTAEGLQHYQQAVDIDPTSDMARGRLARALDAAGRHAEAADQWREAIRLIPTGPARSLTEAIPDLVAAARKSLAAALLSAGRADEAIVECQTILQTRPGQADVLELLGEALLARGDVEAAIPRFEEVLVSEPVNVEVHMRLAAALSERGRAAEALAHLDAAIRLEAQPVAMQQAAWLRATSVEPAVRDGVLAVELAKRSIEYRPSDPRGFDALGAALAETGDFVAALDAASRARDLAQSAGESKLAAAIGARIESYRRGEAIREEGLRLEATGLR
ncbi:MAG TPA: tetratricopeptide repeat protein, partial [Pirellulales bacterium]|nr:tetratricopeptide repeat protein [Pirellulales bacterium]